MTYTVHRGLHQPEEGVSCMVKGSVHSCIKSNAYEIATSLWHEKTRETVHQGCIIDGERKQKKQRNKEGKK
jgi:hypothetical protein